MIYKLTPSSQHHIRLLWTSNPTMAMRRSGALDITGLLQNCPIRLNIEVQYSLRNSFFLNLAFCRLNICQKKLARVFCKESLSLPSHPHQQWSKPPPIEQLDVAMAILKILWKPVLLKSWAWKYFVQLVVLYVHIQLRVLYIFTSPIGTCSCK